MTPVERNVLPARGPSFYREAGEVWFQFVVDPTNTIGPRIATRADQAKHEGAWRDFCRAEAVSPLDRDADGVIGGSLPVEAPLPPMATIDAEPEPDPLIGIVVEGVSVAPEDILGSASAEQAPEAGGEAGADAPAEPRVKRKYTRRAT